MIEVLARIGKENFPPFKFYFIKKQKLNHHTQQFLSSLASMSAAIINPKYSTDQIDLKDPPKDGISSLNFSSHNPDLLLATSWDNSVRIYNVTANTIVSKYEHAKSVLSGCFSVNDQYCFSGDLEGKLMKYNLKTGDASLVGQVSDFHRSAIRCVSVVPNQPNWVITGSWDNTLKLWDISKNTCLQTLDLEKKVYCMDVTPDGTKLLVGTQDLLVFVVALRQDPQRSPLKITTRQNTGLKHQTRCIKCFRDSNSFAIGSLEGRIAVKHIQQADMQNNYAFKCHRTKTAQQVETLYPVNTIATHPKYEIFATGGCDGTIALWDRMNKKKLNSTSPFETSISAISFNCTGNYLAFAVSYTWEMGNQSHPSDRICIKKLV